MKICNKHWIALTEALNPNVLSLVDIVISQEMLIKNADNTLEAQLENFKFGMQFDNNQEKFGEEVEKQGGCPICYLGEDFYNRIVKILNKEEGKVDVVEFKRERNFKKHLQK